MRNRIVDDNMRVRMEWLEVIEAHPDRFLVGADEFVTPEGSPTEPNRSLAETWSMVETLPAELRAKVGRDNAVRVYGLE